MLPRRMLLAGALFAAGCSSSLTARDAGTDVVADADMAADACAWIAGKTFLSLNTMECGLTPTGVAMCNWGVTFGTDGTFSWRHSDYGESGTYTCSGATITGDRGDPPLRTGTLDPQTHLLTWEGAPYAASQ